MVFSVFLERVEKVENIFRPKIITIFSKSNKNVKQEFYLESNWNKDILSFEKTQKKIYEIRRKKWLDKYGKS